MSSEGPYGRQGFQSNPSGYGGTAGGYSAPQYGQGYGGASYAAPAPQAGMYGGGGEVDAGYGGGYSDQVGTVNLIISSSFVVIGDFHGRLEINGRTKTEAKFLPKFLHVWPSCVFAAYLRVGIFEFCLRWNFSQSECPNPPSNLYTDHRRLFLLTYTRDVLLSCVCYRMTSLMRTRQKEARRVLHCRH